MNVYHYTSLDAVKGILRNKDICLWGTRYDSLNDPTDCIYAEEDILPEFKEFLKEKAGCFVCLLVFQIICSGSNQRITKS